MTGNGANVWVFADGWLPKKTPCSSGLEAHEALMILNTGPAPAALKLDFYFDDKQPIKDISVAVAAERVVCIRLDHPQDIGGVELPVMTQYALRVRSDVPVVVQFGRLDTTQDNLAFYVNVGHCS